MTLWLIVSEARKRTDKRISRDGVDRWLGLSNYFSTGPAASRRGKARPVASMILDNPYLTTTGDLLIKRVKRLNKTWITVTIGGGIGLFLHYLALTFPLSIGRRKTNPTLIREWRFSLLKKEHSRNLHWTIKIRCPALYTPFSLQPKLRLDRPIKESCHPLLFLFIWTRPFVVDYQSVLQIPTLRLYVIDRRLSSQTRAILRLNPYFHSFAGWFALSHWCFSYWGTFSS